MEKGFFLLLRSTTGLRVYFSVCLTFGDEVNGWVKNNGSWNVECRELDMW